MIIKLKERAKKDDLEKINFLFNSKGNPDKKISEITKLMVKYKIDKIAEKKIKSYFEDGIKSLRNLKINNIDPDGLINYFNYMMKRKK